MRNKYKLYEKFVEDHKNDPEFQHVDEPETQFDEEFDVVNAAESIYQRMAREMTNNSTRINDLLTPPDITFNSSI